MAAIVHVTHATKRYWLGKTIVEALRGVDLSVEPGEFLAIAGPSGSGKTTLLNLIGCIERPTSGAVAIDGQPVAGLSADALAEVRAQKLGFIFQTFNLLPVLTALENVEYPLSIQRVPAKAQRARALLALERVGLSRHARHRPLELSGGQRQRVAIARAMVTQPRVVLADEPTANLDHATGQEILALMREVNRREQTTFIFSTHDPKVMQMADRIVPLWDGTVGSPP